MSTVRTWFGIVLVMASLAGTSGLYAQGVTQNTFAALEAARKLLDEGKSSSAIKQLQALINKNSERPYDQAVALQMLAHAQISRENYGAAIKSFDQSLALDVLTDTTAQSIRYNLAQLYLGNEQYGKGAALLEKWFSGEADPPANAWALLGGAYMQLKQFRKAVKPYRNAINNSRSPRENWYQALLSAHYELKQYDSCATLLKTMLNRYPQRSSYWKQLAGVHLLRKRPKDAQAILELAHVKDHISSEQELLQLASLYLQNRAPYKAGELLHAEIEAGRIRRSRKNMLLMTNAWQQAQEIDRTVQALRAAISISGNTEMRLRLSRLYMEQGEWESAADTLKHLLDSGKLKAGQVGKAWLLLGISRYEGGQHKDSREAFLSAQKFGSVQQSAEQWLAYLESSG